MNQEYEMLVDQCRQAIAKTVAGKDILFSGRTEIADAVIAALDAHGNFKNWIEASRAVLGDPLRASSGLYDAMPTDQFQRAFLNAEQQ